MPDAVVCEDPLLHGMNLNQAISMGWWTSFPGFGRGAAWSWLQVALRNSTLVRERVAGARLLPISLGRTDLRSDLLGLGRRPSGGGFSRSEPEVHGAVPNPEASKELQSASDLGTHPLRRHGWLYGG